MSSEVSVAGDVTSPLAAGDCPVESSLLPILTSVASLIGCFYVVGTYWYVPALRQHPAGIMFGMSIYGGIYQFLFLLDQSSSAIQCSQIGLFVDFFLTGQETYMLIFAIDLLLALKNPFSTSKGQMKKYHIFGGLWSVVCAVTSHFDTHYALFSFCWASSSDEVLGGQSGSRDPAVAANGTLTAGIFFAVYIVVVYCTSLIAIVRTWNTFMKGLRDTFRTRQRIQRHLKYYVGCYFGFWTLVLACYALFSVLPNPTSASIRTPTDSASSSSSDTSGGVRCRVWHLLSCLLLAKGMVNALIWTRTSNILKIIEQLREFGYVDLPPHDDSINWALRLEILTNTTKGICQSVERAERQARASAASSGSSSSPSSALSAVGGSVDGVGVTFSADLSSEECWEGRDVYAQIEEIILENRNDSSAHGPRSDGVVFFDYAPHVFRRLRTEAHISTSSYRHSLQQTTKERVSEGKSGAFFYFTEDRKYVVKTLTKEELRFLLSILPTYFAFMRENPNTFMTRFFGCHGLTMYGKTVYFVVMQSVFDTNLQIHERFDLKGSWVGRLEGRKPTGTVATCKFCNVEYVVGGSHDQLCDVRRGEGNLRHQYDQVGKDLNWNRHMALPPATARAVAVQLTRDSNFLCSVNCIDYSLLVGIHHRSFNVSHYSSAESFDLPSRGSCVNSSFMSYSSSGGSGGSQGTNSGRSASVCYPRSSEGGSSSSKAFRHASNGGGMSVDEVHGPGIYYLGLIDMLQQWNLRKRVEHFVRVTILLQDRHGISVVNPRQYAERFQKRVIQELIYDTSSFSETMTSSRDGSNVTPNDVQLYQIPALQESMTQAQLHDRGHHVQLRIDSGSVGTRLVNTSPAMLEGPATMDSPARSSGFSMPPQPPLTSRATSVYRVSSLPPVSRRRAATTAAPTTPITWELSGYSNSLGGRLSGGLVMEAPYVRAAPPVAHALLPPSRRPLAVLLCGSPRVSGFSLPRTDSCESMMAHAESSGGCSSGSSASSSCASASTAISIPEALAALDSDYRIARTPTFPDKASGTLSA